MIIDRLTAIHALVGGSISGNDTEVHYNDGQTPPTEKAIEAKIKELQDDYNSKEYQRNRADTYPPIGDQLDALYHAGVFPKEMADKLKAVKDKYKKPE